MKENYFADERGFYGEFGGAYVPEILYKCVHDLQDELQEPVCKTSLNRREESVLEPHTDRSLNGVGVPFAASKFKDRIAYIHTHIHPLI